MKIIVSRPGENERQDTDVFDKYQADMSSAHRARREAAVRSMISELSERGKCRLLRSWTRA